MRKSYKFKKRITQQKSFFYNFQIRAPRVQVIDEAGVHVGEMDTKEAIKIAQERGFDLVEVSPVAKPPVTKIMDYGSFKYQKEKELKKQKAQSKSLDVKSIRLSMKIGEHDKETRHKQAHKFLEKGHKIKVELILRGREMKHQDLGREKIREFVAEIKIPTTVEQDVTKQGNKLFIILIPENK
ncbi:translation initiation factor IF-3 [Candidatus Kuenenbacteria bacterium]|nr:translation initiation factor IF-3 [Candidatus Kuenenbacteria bacterium]